MLVGLCPPKDRERESPISMIAVTALKERAPSPGAAGIEETEGESATAALDTADHRLRGRPRYRVHGTALATERSFHSLKVGNRIEDRRFDEAHDLWE